jgi:hypothetical protein
MLTLWNSGYQDGWAGLCRDQSPSMLALAGGTGCVKYLAVRATGRRAWQAFLGSAPARTPHGRHEILLTVTKRSCDVKPVAIRRGQGE